MYVYFCQPVRNRTEFLSRIVFHLLSSPFLIISLRLLIDSLRLFSVRLEPNHEVVPYYLILFRFLHKLLGYLPLKTF